jgi:hypothetical protein
LACYKQMSARTRATDGARISQGVGDAPNPPPVPPTMAEAIAALVSATTKNAWLLREMAQNNKNAPQGNRGRNNNRNETTYVDFTDTRPPVFTRADEPLEADDWIDCVVSFSSYRGAHSLSLYR